MFSEKRIEEASLWIARETRKREIDSSGQIQSKPSAFRFIIWSMNRFRDVPLSEIQPGAQDVIFQWNVLVDR